jgi:hypothetical protein
MCVSAPAPTASAGVAARGGMLYIVVRVRGTHNEQLTGNGWLSSKAGAKAKN